jgi:hypothetical protein
MATPYLCFGYVSSSGLRQLTILKRLKSTPFELSAGYNIIDKSNLGILDPVNNRNVIALFSLDNSTMQPFISIETTSGADLGDMFIYLNEDSSVANVYRLNRDKLWRFHAHIIFSTDSSWAWINKSFLSAGNRNLIANVTLDKAQTKLSESLIKTIVILDTETTSTQMQTSIG